MKVLVIGFILSIASLASAQQPNACYDGQKIVINGVKMVCDEGRWTEANPAKYTCADGATQYMPVKGVYAGREEITALATCENGKWVFENDAYNYRSTRGVNRCSPEGAVFVEGVDRGNPGITYVCRNGRAVVKGQ